MKFFIASAKKLAASDQKLFDENWDLALWEATRLADKGEIMKAMFESIVTVTAK